jgi:hypothetical protein
VVSFANWPAAASASCSASSSTVGPSAGFATAGVLDRRFLERQSLGRRIPGRRFPGALPGHPVERAVDGVAELGDLGWAGHHRQPDGRVVAGGDGLRALGQLEQRPQHQAAHEPRPGRGDEGREHHDEVNHPDISGMLLLHVPQVDQDLQLSAGLQCFGPRTPV